MIARFRADPFFAIAPPDGTRIAEKSQPGSCDAAAARSSMGGPGPTVVSRTYQTPEVYGLDRLHQLFDQPAEAAGWRLVDDFSDPGEPGYPPISTVTYCKQTSTEAYVAEAESGLPDSPRPGIVVSIRNYGDSSLTRCSQLIEPPPSGPVPTCPPTLHCGALPDSGTVPVRRPADQSR